MGPLRPLEFDDAVYVFLRVFLYIRERRKRRSQSVAGTHRAVSFLFLSCRGMYHPQLYSVKNMPRIQKPLLKYARHHRARLRTNTPPRARRDVAKERATPPSLFWGSSSSSSSICRDVFLSPVVYSSSKDDVFSRTRSTSVFFPSRRRSRKNGGKERRGRETERRRRVHLRVFFRRFVGVADCFCVLHVRSIRVRKGGSGTGGETGQGESESGAQDAVCSVAFGRDYCRWK